MGDGQGYSMGRVVQNTNQFNRERGIPEQLNYYSSGFIFFVIQAIMKVKVHNDELYAKWFKAV